MTAALLADLTDAAVLTRDAEAFDRAFRFLRHARAHRKNRAALTWDDAERALHEQGITVRALAAKAAR